MIGNATADIALGSVGLNAVDSNGATWAFDTITGWHSGPGVEVQQTQRAVGHGQFARKGRRTGRQIIVSGHVYADTRGPVEQASRTLAALLADGDSERFYFNDTDGPTLWTNVQLADAPRIDWPGLNHFRYQLTLLAPDAFRYGETSTASTTFATDPVGRGLRYPAFSPSGVMYYGPPPTSDGTVTLTNYGSAPGSPLFTVDGPGPVGGFSIVDIGAGKRLTYLGAIPNGGRLVLDASDGSVLLDGTADRSGDVISMGWPVVGPGETATFRFAAESTASAALLTVSLTSCYW